jgi:hypothetical protein
LETGQKPDINLKIKHTGLHSERPDCSCIKSEK